MLDLNGTTHKDWAKEMYENIAHYSDEFHQVYGPIVARPNDTGAILDPDLPSAAWLTEQRA